MPRPIQKGRVGGQIPQQQASGNTGMGQAVNSVGQAIGQTGDLLADMQEEKERQWIASAEIDFNKAAGELQVKLAKQANPETHIETAKAYFEGVRTKILGRAEYPRKFRDKLSRRMELYASRRLEKIGTESKLAQIDNGRRINNARISNSQVEADYDGARRLVEEGKGLYYTDEMADMKIKEIDRRERNEAWEAEADRGNSEYFDQDGLPMEPSDQRRFKKRAESAKARAESKAMDGISGAMALGVIKTKDDLQAKLDANPSISDNTRKLALANWDKTKPLSYEEKSGVTSALNENHRRFRAGEIDKDEYAKNHHDLATSVYAMGSRDGTGGLRTRVHHLDPAKWNENNLQAGKAEEMEMDIETMVETWARAGGFGKPGRGEDPLTPSQALDSQMAQELTETAMKEWMKTEEGQKATPDEVKRKLMQEAAASSVGFSIDEAFEDEASELDSILAGDSILPKAK